MNNKRCAKEPFKQPWYTQGPFIFKDIVQLKMCHAMLVAFWQGRPQARTFNGVLKPNFRRADFVVLGEKFLPVFKSFVIQHLEQALSIKCSLKFPHLPIAYRYPVGPGFKVHHDRVNEEEIRWAKLTGQPIMGGDITLILGINDPAEYTGGELFFPNHQMELKFNPGTFVAYPNTEEFLHGVKPITKGERYSVVCRVNVMEGSLINLENV